jgi:hypothetical protein
MHYARYLRTGIATEKTYRKGTKSHLYKHGMCRTKTYKSWDGMKYRCSSLNKDYGGRGIGVCKRWLNSFQNFYDDMGERPDGMTLERKDNNKGYNPENCVWATPATQAHNRRDNKLNAKQVEEIRRLWAAGGVTQKELGEKYKVGFETIGRIVRNERWVRV